MILRVYLFAGYEGYPVLDPLAVLGDIGSSLFKAASRANVSRFLEDEIKIVLTIDIFALVESKDGMKVGGTRLVRFLSNNDRAELGENRVALESMKEVLGRRSVCRHIGSSKNEVFGRKNRLFRFVIHGCRQRGRYSVFSGGYHGKVLFYPKKCEKRPKMWGAQFFLGGIGPTIHGIRAIFEKMTTRGSYYYGGMYWS